MWNKQNVKLTGIDPETLKARTQTEALSSLLKIREAMRLCTPKPFHYTQLDFFEIELNELLEAQECLRKKDYIFLLSRVKTLFYIGDLSCSSLYSSLMTLLNKI